MQNSGLKDALHRLQGNAMQREHGVNIYSENTGFGLGGNAVVHRGLQLGGLECVLRHRALPMAQRCGHNAQTSHHVASKPGMHESNAHAATLEHLCTDEWRSMA